jgi:hypothetical protein
MAHSTSTARGCSAPESDIEATAERAAEMRDLMEDRERLETIVRALAVFDPGVEIPTSSTINETATLCVTCDTVLAGDVWDESQGTFVVGPHPHKPECPWVLARTWVEAHPAQRIDLHGE